MFRLQIYPFPPLLKNAEVGFGRTAEELIVV
jgi:hypothetical protein